MKYKEADFSKWDSIPDEQTFNDWVLMRKENKAPTTQTALNRSAKWINLFCVMGYPANTCLEIACDLGWKGLEWVYNEERKKGFPESPRHASVPRIGSKPTRDIGLTESLTDRSWAGEK